MLAIRAAHAFDGEKVWPGGAVVLIDGGRIAGVEPPGFASPQGTEVIDFDALVRWGGDRQPSSDNPEARLVDDFLRPRDWLAGS